MISRRQLLAVSALSATGLGALAVPGTKPARAFSFEQADDNANSQYLRARACFREPNDYHRQLADEVRTMLRQRNVEVSDEDIRIAVAQTTCPLCGCPIDS